MKWLRPAAVMLGATINVTLVFAPTFALISDVRLDTAALVFAGLVWAACAVEAWVHDWEPRLAAPSAGGRWLLYATGLGLLLTWQFGLADHVWSQRGLAFAPLCLGASLMAIGIVLRATAIRALGAYFLNEVRMEPGQPLVVTGLYARLRHPSELGTLCLVLGGILLLSGWLALVPGLLVAGLIHRRIRLEDALLAQRHPEAFRRYSQRVTAFGVRPGFAGVRGD